MLLANLISLYYIHVILGAPGHAIGWENLDVEENDELFNSVFSEIKTKAKHSNFLLLCKKIAAQKQSLDYVHYKLVLDICVTNCSSIISPERADACEISDQSVSKPLHSQFNQ